jgi:ferritin-like metal-binding protein YciE
MKMGDKRQETITKYLGDMKSVVSHVQTAMERQRDEFKDKPDVSQTMGRIAFGLQRHSESIGRRLEALGGSPTHPVKEVVSDAVGIVAGLYNKVRTEGAAKGLRDDHVALNLVCISYSTLHTTAVALGDPETASLAKRSLAESAKFVTEIDTLLPPTVFQELQDGEFGGSLDSSAPAQTRAAYREAWTADLGSSARELGQEERLR